MIDFAKDYIQHSDNTENIKCKRIPDRLSVESVCAGPGVPLLYAFLKTRTTELKDTFEHDGIDFNKVTSKMIIDRAMQTEK